MSSLVGRAGDVAEVKRLLTAHRLVTLTGPPGVGKSRLAVEVVAQLAESVAHGPHWLELPALADLDDLSGPLAAALDGGDLGPALLVVNDADDRVAECAELLAGELASRPGLQVLVTSREPLSVAGEMVWRVAPLPVTTAAGELGPAVELFRQRAEAVYPAFVLDERTAPTVVHICRRLDGLPLAIELAAARAGVLSLAQVAAGIDDRFQLLRGASRTAAARHRSMAGALDSSHRLLAEPEQVLLRRLAVFSAGCTLEAARYVCCIPELAGPDPADVLDVLGQLVAKSVVMADIAGSEARYRMLDTVRHYATDRLLEASEVDELLTRLSSWSVHLAERASRELEGPQEVAWLTRLEAEYPNLVVTLSRLSAAGPPESAVRLAVALVPFWRQDRVSEGKLALYRLLEASHHVPSRLRAQLLWGLGLLASTEGRFAAAVAPLDEALALARAEGDERTVARTLLLLAICAVTIDGPAASLPLAEESLAMARDLGDPWCAAAAVSVAALANQRAGEPARALSLAESAVALARGGELVSGLARALTTLGYLAIQAGDDAVADAALNEALELSELVGSAESRTLVLTNLADLALARGRSDEASALLDEAMAAGRNSDPLTIMQPLFSLGRMAEWEGDASAARARFSDVLSLGETVGFDSLQARHGLGRAGLRDGDDPDTARRQLRAVMASAKSIDSKAVTAAALHDLGELARRGGHHDQAASLHRRALLMRQETADRAGVAESLDALGGTSIDEGRFDRAARLFGAAERARQESGVARPPADRPRYDADVAQARESLGDRFAAEWSRGEAMAGDDAIAAAIGRRPSWRPTTGWPSLTPAERDVVALVVEGSTNRQVGERLRISRRTVQSHLAHVFAKLGVRSRTELATQCRLQSEGDAGLADSEVFR